MSYDQIRASKIPGRILTGFGIFLGLSAAILPSTTHAFVEVIADPITFRVTIEDYYELSVISNTAGTGVSFASNTYSATMTNGTANTAFGTTVLGAVCNSTRNWQIQAESALNNGSNVSIMKGQSTNLDILSGSTTLDGSVSTWTMTVSAGDNTPTIPSTYQSAHVIPAVADTIATGTYGDLRTVNVVYGVAVGPSQAADTYIGSIKYTLSPQS